MIRELGACSDLLAHVESRELNDEQARAVVCFDNRVQLIASAGSGKTSTMVAKAIYAVHRGFVAPSEIIILAFNKDAAQELEERGAQSLARLGMVASRARARLCRALPIAALTAWYSLVDYGQLKPGQTVLVQGTGGVSIFAIQLAAAMGAKVIVTSSSDENLTRAMALGAEAGINYRKTPDWETEVLALTEGKGVDLLLDVAGGDGINQSIAATKAAGRIAQIGFLTGQSTNLSLMPLIFRQTTIRGIAVAPRSSFDRMNEFLNQHAISPVIDHVYPFEQAREAYEHLSEGAFGKVVISVGP